MQSDQLHPLSKSTLAKTILRTNPAEDRRVARLINNINRLTIKADKTYENRRMQFLETFGRRRVKRQKLFATLRPTLTPSTRQAINKIKQLEHRREGRNILKANSKIDNRINSRVKLKIEN